jgi:exodeoxyribonuclease V gamma subunit
VDIRVSLADGRLLTGTVAGLRGDLLLATTYSRVAAKHRLAAWVRLLALTATRPERPFEAATVGRGSGRDDVRCVSVLPLADVPEQRLSEATAALTGLVELYDLGMREPLPLFAKTSAAYAEAARAGQDPTVAAEREWHAAWGFELEDSELEHQLVLGGVRTFSELLEIEPRARESDDGWDRDETSRVGRLARRLWDPLLEREEARAR